MTTGLVQGEGEYPTPVSDLAAGSGCWQGNGLGRPRRAAIAGPDDDRLWHQVGGIDDDAVFAGPKRHVDPTVACDEGTRWGLRRTACRRCIPFKRPDLAAVDGLKEIKGFLARPRFTSRQYPTIRGIGKDFRIIRGALVDRGLLHEMHSLRDGGHRWMVPTDQNSASRAAIDIDAVERSRSAENISRHRSRHIDLVLVRGWTPMESGSGRGEHHG